MRNRDGVFYEFIKVDDKTFTIDGNLTYWRCGAKEGQNHIDENDLGFVDPSGGPFISIGTEIEDQPITRIFKKDGQFHFEVA